MIPREFHWTPQPAAARYIHGQLEKAESASPWLAEFARRLRDETGTRLVDWVDHLEVASADGLAEVGFSLLEKLHEPVWVHHDGLFPQVLVNHQHRGHGVGLKVECVEDFLSTHELPSQIERLGTPGGMYCSARWEEGGLGIRVVERHGYPGLDFATTTDAACVGRVESMLTLFRERNRSPEDALHSFADAEQRFQTAAVELGGGDAGRNWACDLFFQVEREYWQSRNHAGRVQYSRQNQLGVGWANHDHHTFRCSRELFAPLVRVLELQGFRCRERFYAGSDAGWGAQVLEQPDCGIVIFADVDMSEEELTGDFSHDGLVAREDLGTVGLWCRLHGDSFLSAGMHHLECQFDFDAARQQLLVAGIETMAPFTDFPHLRQAFTKGERWRVDPIRMASLLAQGLISQSDVDRFASEGALGSHLEILERNDGYKGFNQTGISKIIHETNPRRI